MRRCICIVTSNPPKPPNPGGGDCPYCFHIPSLYLPANESVGPCNEVGQIDLLEHADVDICSVSTDGSGNPIICPITWKVTSYGKGIAFTPTIVNGILSFTTSPNLEPGELTYINVKAECGCKPLSAFINIQIAFKDLCSGVNCQEGYHCDPCTGTCILNTADFSGEKKSISSTALSGITFKK